MTHTAAGLTINENADTDVARDTLACLARLVPGTGDYRHAEGNSDAHIKASLMGSSLMVPVIDGRLALGHGGGLGWGIGMCWWDDGGVKGGLIFPRSPSGDPSLCFIVHLPRPDRAWIISGASVTRSSARSKKVITPCEVAPGLTSA